MLKSVVPWLKNKYVLTLIGFAVWLLFFDHNNVFLQWNRTAELRDLKKSKAYYTGQIETAQKELNELQNDPGSLEKAAREKYGMKKDDEDLFLVDEK